MRNFVNVFGIALLLFVVFFLLRPEDLPDLGKFRIPLAFAIFLLTGMLAIWSVFKISVPHQFILMFCRIICFVRELVRPSKIVPSWVKIVCIFLIVVQLSSPAVGFFIVGKATLTCLFHNISFPSSKDKGEKTPQDQSPTPKPGPGEEPIEITRDEWNALWLDIESLDTLISHTSQTVGQTKATLDTMLHPVENKVKTSYDKAKGLEDPLNSVELKLWPGKKDRK